MGEAGEGGKSHIQEAILKGSSTVNTSLCDAAVSQLQGFTESLHTQSVEVTSCVG